MGKLYDTLVEYGKSDMVPLHMPGHKRIGMKFENPYCFDITEIDGFDNLHHAGGILKDAQEHAAKVCGADETHFMVNGSTGGILSALFSATKQGGEILMARNCHRSVYHGVELRQLTPHYLYPETLEEGILGEITAEMAEKAMEEYPGAKTLILTSPTYDGVVSDIRKIVNAAHAKGVTVIVDEAHGAHFLKGSGFCESAVTCGADLVIQSTHKTLPALTQTALIHVNSAYPEKERLLKYLSVFQTSSPSYVLMASIDSAMYWYEEEGKRAYGNYLIRLRRLRASLEKELCHLQLLTPCRAFDYDISKILISTRSCNLSAAELHQRLLKNDRIQSEMVSSDYVLFMTSVADTDEFYDRFLKALLKIDRELETAAALKTVPESQVRPKLSMEISLAAEKNKKAVPLLESVGKISASYVVVYPPGIPILTPGEIIDSQCADMLRRDLENHLEVLGLTEEGEIEIVWEKSFT